MRITKTALVLTLCALSALALAAGKPVNYAGTWVLDKAQSKNLPPFYEQVDSHTLFATQNEQALNVEVEIRRQAGAAGAARPVQPGANGRVPLEYRFDGKPVASVRKGQVGGQPHDIPSTTVTTVDEQGRVHIAVQSEIPTSNGAMLAKSDEEWSLSADGATLTVRRNDESPMNKRSSELVFVRK